MWTLFVALQKELLGFIYIYYFYCDWETFSFDNIQKKKKNLLFLSHSYKIYFSFIFTDNTLIKRNSTSFPFLFLIFLSYLLSFFHFLLSLSNFCFSLYKIFPPYLIFRIWLHQKVAIGMKEHSPGQILNRKSYYLL